MWVEYAGLTLHTRLLIRMDGGQSLSSEPPQTWGELFASDEWRVLSLNAKQQIFVKEYIKHPMGLRPPAGLGIVPATPIRKPTRC